MIYILLVLASALLAVDLAQTLDIKNHPALQETNMLLGEHPSDQKIIIYFLLVFVAFVSFVLWATTARPQEDIAEIACVILYCVEIPVILNNHKLGLKL